MKNKLLWKMYSIIAVGTVLLFWAIDVVNRQTENRMSFIAPVYQQEMVDYARQAEAMFVAGEEEKLADWIKALEEKEDTWVAIVQNDLKTFADTSLSERYLETFTLGRSVTWKIHLYFKENPTMDVPFADGETRFLIQLPQRMRPGDYYPLAQIMLQIALPFVLLCLLSWVLYWHVMKPLRTLEKATRQFSEGRYDVRVRECLGKRDDELTSLAGTFDQMAEHTGKLINNQRHLLEDLSHELRTPLARLDMAVEHVGQGLQPDEALQRLRGESSVMRELVEDTLMLVWLNNESPQLCSECFDLAELLQVIGEDARFEYPRHRLTLCVPEQVEITHSSQRAVGQALENIIRNALQHTPEGREVRVVLNVSDEALEITVTDEGPGVPEPLLQDIFRPFFQVDKSRSEKSELLPIAEGRRRGGFGLGLALAQRQTEAVGGTLTAENALSATGQVTGLQIRISLPV
ncbi:sensor histidine kinase [Aliamphritea spongicola]|uniref:sensor histidine kinase n=1 Tax=Aliamphritea spongicola TaxID=707589 RepID=UPI00196A7FAD|nr:sensor histidine kinase [Aliamphritea spongicola]MBN3562714.1 histidine kinase sensor domain-containing protein [Aliamphritea spongicola]